MGVVARVAIVRGVIVVDGSALVVGAWIRLQRVAGMAPGTVEARLLGRALLLYMADCCLLVRSRGADAKGRRALGLLGVILGRG